MPYVVHIWPAPRPASYEEAVSLLPRLARLDGPAHPLLLQLTRLLTARHADLDDDGDDDDAVWTDGPLADNARAGVMGLGVRTHAFDTVVPFIVSTARTLGLVVLDEQEGALHLPDSQTLRPAGLRAPLAPAAIAAGEPVPRGAVRNRMRAALGPLLQAEGFSPATGDADYSLTGPAACLEVQIAVESRGIGCSVSVVLTLCLPGAEPDPLVLHVMPRGAAIHFHAHRIAAAAGLAWSASTGSIGAETHVETASDVDALAARWVRLFEAELLPRARRCATLDGLTHELITRLDSFTVQRLVLLLAASTGRRDLKALHDDLLRVQPPNWHAETTELLAWLQTPRQAALDAEPARKARLGDALPLLLGGGPPLQAAVDGRLLAVPDQPVTRRIIGGMALACVAEDEGRLAPLLHRQIAAWGATPQDTIDAALGNLQTLAVQALHQAPAEGFTWLHLDGRVDASLLLLDALWDHQLRAQTPAGAVAAVPRPGLLAFSDIATPGALPALRAFVAREAADEATALSRDLFYRRDRQWERMPARP